MKGTFFSKQIEWNIETQGESWTQGATLQGSLLVKNHGQGPIDLSESGVAVAYAEVKKIHAKVENALKFDLQKSFEDIILLPGQTQELSFTFNLPVNCPVSDKKGGYYLTYGKNFSENHLQLKIEPRALFTKLIGLLDTFYRFKLKEFKMTKSGVEYKLIPPTSREMANVESLLLTLSMDDLNLILNFDFIVKKLDTASVTTKLNKESFKTSKTLPPQQYSLGKDIIHQDQLLKVVESVIAEVKLKSVY